MKNGVHWVAADLAALGLGLAVVPLYVDDNPENVAWCLENSGARLLVVESSRIAVALAQVSTAVPRVLCLAADPGSGYEPLDAVLPRQAPGFEVVPLEDGALATICYTSGTAGRPKGSLSARKWLTRARCRSSPRTWRASGRRSCSPCRASSSGSPRA